MPHSERSLHTPKGVKACPYCGAAIRWTQTACFAHRDLPALEPLDDRYVLTEDEKS